MAAISGGRANDECVKCLRIFADGNGETHMEDIDITLQPKKLFVTSLGALGNGLAQSAAATACALANRRGRIRDERWRHPADSPQAALC
jgi:hypothetical protein